jgi:hypothetical protein
MLYTMNHCLGQVLVGFGHKARSNKAGQKPKDKISPKLKYEHNSSCCSLPTLIEKGRQYQGEIPKVTKIHLLLKIGVGSFLYIHVIFLFQ